MLDNHIRGLRTQLRREDEGSLWLLFLDDPHGDVVLATSFEGAMAHVDAELTRNLVRIISHVPSAAVLLAVPRADGQPLNVDKRLWHDLEGLLTDPLIDLVVVGESSYWSARRAAA